MLAAEVDAQSFGCVGEAEATYGWGLLLLLLLFLLLLLGVVVVEGDHCAFGHGRLARTWKTYYDKWETGPKPKRGTCDEMIMQYKVTDSQKQLLIR